jgi:hypothetical protein
VGINTFDDGSHDVFLYNITNATVTTSFLTTLVTPGLARAVSIYNGLAYVADSGSGMQVINYLAADTQRRPPTVSLAASFSLSPPEVEETKSVRVTATVTDDVQVRNVEFYVDGVKVATDGNFPFEHRFVTPRRGTRDSFKLRLRASDTGGNATFTDELTVTLLPDQSPPLVTRTIPAVGGIGGSVRTVAAFFNEPLNPASLGSATFQLRSFGPDEIPDNADDVSITSGTVSYREELNGAFLTLTNELAPGLYRASLLPPLADLRGNALTRAFFWTFIVVAGPDADQDGVPDALEPLLGLDPNNSDSNGNGISDGFEDFDNDGLVNAAEVLLGTTATNPDTNGNGIRDGDEDGDGDGLKNSVEIVAGTNARRADSDADGWNDEVELTVGTNPLDALSFPRWLAVVAQPPVRVIIGGLGTPGGLALNITIAQPPVRVITGGLGDSGGLLPNTTIAQPPVRVIAGGLGSSDGLPPNTTIAQPPISVRFE